MPESLICALLAEDINKGKGVPLVDSDPFAAAQQRVKLEQSTKEVSPMGILMTVFGYKGTVTESVQKFKDEGVPKVEKYVKELLNGKDFAGGSTPDIVDINIITLLERLVMIEGTAMNDLFEFLDLKKNAPTIYAYVHRFRALPQVQGHVLNHEYYKKYIPAWLKLEAGQRQPLLVAFVK